MIFVSDVHYQVEYLNSLPQNKGPIVILGDLINWIDYRDGQGIAMDVFGKDNVEKLINLRKEHKFDERKTLWKELYKTDPDKIAKKMQNAKQRVITRKIFYSVCVLSDSTLWR